jgi:hypothetical protein
VLQCEFFKGLPINNRQTVSGFLQIVGLFYETMVKPFQIPKISYETMVTHKSRLQGLMVQRNNRNIRAQCQLFMESFLEFDGQKPGLLSSVWGSCRLNQFHYNRCMAEYRFSSPAAMA